MSDRRTGLARWRPAAAAGLVLGVGLTAGCGGSGGTQEAAAGTSSASITATTASSTAAPTPSTTKPPVPRTFAATPEGAEKFVRHYVDVYRKAAGNPAQWQEFQSLGTVGCVPCSDLSREIELDDRFDRRQTGKVLTLGSVRALPQKASDPADVVTVDADVRQHPGRIVDSSGSTVETIAEARLISRFKLNLTDTAWIVADIDNRTR
ncbi:MULTISPECIES: hypothetical protein [Barrientosiimonas]|uniref:Lipoprotein n=1 Tax=Barrientosiimonas endolithica TaxID=1535208 RepID=A0ABN6YXB3_9MICO|nr:hypothetical protein [Barrientosiimonas endolithica]BDZ59986.1 hypothetical protein GCM10025872_36430 [Barrientosiimonas endolithica]